MNPIGAVERLERNARRGREIASVLVRYGLADWLRRLPGERVHEWLRDSEGHTIPELEKPERIRLALTELGTTFIKLGQMLSTRPDVVGPQVAHELAKLQIGTPPDPPGVAQATLERELGHPAHALFDRFEPEPFASASIAQVHYARLASGEEVVVKIQKAGIEERIEADLAILADLAQLVERHVAQAKPYRPVAVVRQFSRMLRGELDFGRERRNLEQFRRNFADDATVHFPRPWPERSTRGVLTMERLDGVLISHAEALREVCEDIDAFARRGANMYLEMIFRDAFYHADPHPGNLMRMPGEVVGVLDCGMVQRLDEDLRERIEDLLLALTQGDPVALAEAVWNLGASPPAGEREELSAELSDFAAEHVGQPIDELQLGTVLSGLIDVIHRNHVYLPAGASILLRTLVELEGTAQILNPSFSLAEVIAPYCRKAAQRRLAPGRLAVRLQRGLGQWERLLRLLPGDLNDMLRRIRAGTLSVHLDHRRLDPVANRLVMGLLTSSLFLGSSLLWSLKAPPLVWDVSLFGAIGYGLALVLGFKLYRAIRRSERAGPDEG